MQLIDITDNILRKLILKSRLSGIRKSNPAIYNLLRKNYERVLSIKSKTSLSRYQIRAVKNFAKFVNSNNLDKPILEIGSDLNAKVVIELKNSGFNSVIGINPEFRETELQKINSNLPEGCILSKGDIRNSGFADNTAGAIFSVSVFEHLQDFNFCLSEMYRIVAHGGCVYAEFGPIWSSSLGHHVCASVPGEEARHWDPTKNPIPNHGHLLMDISQMRKYLDGRVSQSLILEIIDWIYQTKNINRLFFEDYIRLFRGSNFDIISMKFDREHIPTPTLKVLRSIYPKYKIFDVRNIQVVLKKQ